MAPPPLASREAIREERFSKLWTNELNDAFADIAPYYDRGNEIAALGLWSSFLKRFMRTVDIRPNQKVLDVCGGTNAVGIALLKREPTLDVHAIDRSAVLYTGQVDGRMTVDLSRLEAALINAAPLPPDSEDIPITVEPPAPPVEKA